MNINEGKTITLFCLSALLLLPSCRQEADPGTDTIDIFKGAREVSFTRDLYSASGHLVLNTGDLIIGDKSALHFKKFPGGFAIRDWYKALYVFDDNGMLRTSISKIGRGPGEYRVINDFHIDDDGQIRVLCNSDKLIFYENSGQFIREEPITFPACAFAMAGDGSYIFFLSRYGDTSLGSDRIAVTDSCLNIRASFLPLFSTATSSGQSMNYIPGADSFLCCQYYDNFLYRVGPEGVEHTYELDFKTRSLPEEFSHASNLDEAYRLMETINDAWYTISAYENSDYILATLGQIDSGDTSNGALWLMQKSSRKSWIQYYNIEDKEFNGLGYPLFLSESNEIYYISSKAELESLKDTSLPLPDLDGIDEDTTILLKFKINL